MICCPNRNRKRTASPGGGKPGCKGHLEVIVSVPISFYPTRHLKLNETLSDILPYHYRNGLSVRVPNTAVHAVIKAGSADLVCPLCGWSLRRLQIKPAKARAVK